MNEVQLKTDDLMQFQSEVKINENGKLRQEGKEYIVILSVNVEI